MSLVPQILIAEPDDFSPAAVDILRTVGNVELRACSHRELPAAFQEYDVVWFRLAHRIDDRIIGSAPRCRILATPVTGLDHLDLETCKARGIQVISLRGEVDFLKNIRATAELTVGLMLSVMRHIPAATQAVRRGEWNRDQFRGHELFSRTAGIVGMGRLGTLVAGYLRGFGMRVVGFDPRPDFPTAAAERVESLDQLLHEANMVVLLVKYDATTRNLIGEKQFGLMKPGAVLINTSRGGVIDEKALLTALSSGRLAGAALDVLDGEPAIDSSHALVGYAAKHDNLVLTPHLGGNTFESFEKTEMFLAHKVARALTSGSGKTTHTLRNA